jgi:magnesium chelatase accessory protein
VSGRYPDWATDGKDWPNRAASSFVRADGYHWHVQRAGKGPVCLLLHGTGAATHSWRDIFPRLSESFDVIAIDLPGHGFTRALEPRKVSLAGMAASIARLLAELEAIPDLIVGHSAGAAIGAQMILDGKLAAPLVGFMPALMPFPGLAARIFPSLAKMLFTNPFAAVIFSRIAAYPGETEKFLRRSTGSTIDAQGNRLYTRLFSRSGHCDGAIRMMANWQLEPLRDRLGQFKSPVLLVQASHDAAIPRSAFAEAAAHIPGCQTAEMPGLGHLAHEENPDQAVQIMTEFAKTCIGA